MRKTVSKYLFLILAALLLSGCCYFVPCHPATYITGVVIDGVSNQAIPEAAVRLYYYQTHTTSMGCFSIGGADAPPFEFGVSAPGYKPVVVKAVRGFYRAKVVLMPESSVGESTSNFIEISHNQFTELSQS
tara:strand:+ start:46 stop:438 length:393 start_codon:yes stop_codon:yes gene_type:complete